MASEKGKLTTCDRCGAQVFAKHIGKGEADGGYTTWDKYEELPEGWEHLTVGRVYRDLCPACSYEWLDKAERFMKKPPQIMEG